VSVVFLILVQNKVAIASFVGPAFTAKYTRKRELIWGEL
jgi:hypothetical protein